MGYVSARSTCGPPLILYATLKRWGPPMLQGLCTHPALLWDTSHFLPSNTALVTPSVAAVV